MKKLVHTLNGVNYLLFECPFPISGESKLHSFYKKLSKFNGILQGADKVEGGFWGHSYLKVTVLVPEENAFIFSESEMR